LPARSSFQGALVEIVRDVHEARRPKSIGALLRPALRRLVSLIGASLTYAFGVFFGLVLLVVPGLPAASRWCLMAPLIMLEGETVGGALKRSDALITPHTWRVAGVVVATSLVTLAVAGGVSTYVAFGDIPLLWGWLARVGVLSITAPFSAHVLSVLYYAVTDPERPVIDPDVRTWRSVWQGA
jgi:hypothetical protein